MKHLLPSVIIYFSTFVHHGVQVFAQESSSCKQCSQIWDALQPVEDLENCNVECQNALNGAGLQNALMGSGPECIYRCCKKMCQKRDAFKACKKVGICAVKDIRFNKLPCTQEDYSMWNSNYVKPVHKLAYPMMPDDYPLDESKAEILKRQTKADSVVIPGDYQLYGENLKFWLSEDEVTKVVVDPIYPGDDDGLFWEELERVVVIAKARQEGQLASEFYEWPECWKNRNSVKLSPWPGDDSPSGGLTLQDVAAAVYGEYPAYHQQVLIKKLFDETGIIDIDLGQPFRSKVDFIGKPVRMAAINTWAFEVVAPINFMLKWHFGVPRPEEMVWKIYRGELSPSRDGVPEDLADLIQDMDLENAHEFTAYRNTGAPFHPSYPAMHSAGSTCSLWLAALCKLTADQYLEALRVDYAVAMARTVAGVHYEQDNIVGLNVGQRIMREKLPAYLEEQYGYNGQRVKERLDKLSFDWKDFDSKAGTIGGMTADEFLRRATEGQETYEIQM